jgi:hypothetical protein
MVWSQLEPTGPHVTYVTLTFFLILYALFSLMIRNRLHLSEPPLATLFGIVSREHLERRTFVNMFGRLWDLAL